MRKMKETLIRVGEKCNNNCKYCGLIGRKASYDKTTDEIKAELDSAKHTIRFPCNADIRQDFLELVEYANGLGKKVILETNGRMFSYAKFGDSTTDLIDKFEVFLNGSEEVHDKITRAESFKQTIRGVENICKITDKIRVNTVIIEANYKHLKDLVHILMKLGVDEWRPIYPIGDNVIAPSVPYPYVDEAIESAGNIKVITGEVFHNPYISDDLNLDYDTAKLEYRHIEDHKEKKVSIIIPTYNREKLLKNTLAALFLQDYPKEKYEIIVVDDGGQDGTLEMIKGLEATCNLKYVYWPRNKPYVFGEAGNRAGPARNIGVQHSLGGLLIFIDSDVLCAKDFIQKHLIHHKVKEKIVVFGNRQNLTETFTKKKKAIMNMLRLGSLSFELDHNDQCSNLLLELNDRMTINGNSYSDCEYPWLFFMSHNVSIKRKNFVTVGDFERNFVFFGMEDQEWLYRCTKRGFKAIFDNLNPVYHMFHKPEFLNENTWKKHLYRINQCIVYSKHLDYSFMHSFIYPKHYMKIHDNKKLANMSHYITQKPSALVTQDERSNWICNQNEFTKQLANLSSYPHRLYVELTRNCNMNCQMCFQSNQKYKGENLTMSFDFFKTIANQLFPYAKFIDLRGFGESTLLPNFLSYVNYALRFQSDIGVVTNLSVNNNKMWEHLIRNNFWLGISLDGPNKETFGKIRAQEYFTQVISNIKLLVRLSKKFRKNIDRLYLLVVVQKDNVHVLPDFVALAKELGVRHIEFKPVRSNNPEFLLHDVNRILAKNLRDSIALAKQQKINLKFTGSFDKKLEESLGYEVMKKCSRPWTHLYITYNGFIGPCNHRPDLFFGNLKYFPFNKIWNNQYYQLFRRIINTANRPERCDQCFEDYFDNEWS